jgi:molybdopterin synthase sulfurtransferase
MTEITGKELLGMIGQPDVRIIDVRPADAYNGWKMHGEFRGGHIKGARSLPLKWFNYIDWIEIVRQKNILPFHRIIIYGYNSPDAREAALRFMKSGYNLVMIYAGFRKEWAENESFPMQHLERYRHLVYADWVRELADGNSPPEYDNERFKIVHVHYRNRDAYFSGHIPGAIDMDTLELESPDSWNRRSPGELKEALERHGITAGTTVVLYGKYQSPDNNDPFPGSAAGDIGAMRCAFIMLYAGVKDVRVLNGGFQSWQDAGLDVSYSDEPRRAVDDFGGPVPLRPELAVDTPEAKEMLKRADSNLVCVRSWSEFTGEVSGYNYIAKKGRIKGTVFADSGSDAYHMENYRNLDHTTREFHEISDIWEKNGITPDKHLAFYCGTGWRGSEAFINAWLMGWPRISVYDGGWFEWSSDPDNPVETGTPVLVENLSNDIQ